LKSIVFPFLGQKLHLLPERSIWWDDQRILIFADLHIGKAAHFRKNGIPVPAQLHADDLQKLREIIRKYVPIKILFLGDLFHSKENADVLDFSKITAEFSDVEFHLILGNHDILTDDLYQQLTLTVHKHFLSIHPFVFVHDASDAPLLNEYPITGHVHPVISLEGKGRQSMRFPCFYFGKSYAILPAFGGFKGGVEIKTQKGEVIFGVSKNGVFDLNEIM
jgi:DNA ligase-associated metallophosphoesterase